MWIPEGEFTQFESFNALPFRTERNDRLQKRLTDRSGAQ
jgi:hypothetical protein